MSLIPLRRVIKKIALKDKIEIVTCRLTEKDPMEMENFLAFIKLHVETGNLRLTVEETDFLYDYYPQRLHHIIDSIILGQCSSIGRVELPPGI